MNVAPLAPLAGKKSIIATALSHLRRNELSEAGSLLAKALADAPNDPSFLHLLGTVRHLERRDAEAERLYRQSLTRDPAQPLVHRDLGKLLAGLGRVDDAIVEFREVTRLRPGDAEAHFTLATALARRGNHADAGKSYREVLRLTPDHPGARLGLGDVLCKLDRPHEAERLLRQALAAGAGEPRLAATLAHKLGIALQRQKKFVEALSLFDAAQAKVADFPAVDFARGEALQQMGRWEEAGLCFRKVLARRPEHVNAAACLALISAIDGRFAEAREWSTKVLARQPSHPIAHIALAMAEIDTGDFSNAEERLRVVIENAAEAREQGAAYAAAFAADAFERCGRYREAFAVSRASKAILRELWPSQPGSRRMVDIAGEFADYFEKSKRWDAAEISGRGADLPAAHVFILGFQRSGTTLLETILATDPGVLHAHEIDFFDSAARDFLTSEAGLDRLAVLGPNRILEWRDTYWNAAREANFSVGGKIFVDKMPTNTFRLPLIARLFPSARIVLALRDPRDVVLSCYRRQFDPTPYSREFLHLEDCARFYAATMKFADICRQKLPLNILEHRYEDMVAGFSSSLSAVCNFTGVRWSESMRNFQDAANTIDLRSASARQVRRGLYTDAIGQWRHYRDELAPVLPILAPWVTRFGYPSD